MKDVFIWGTGKVAKELMTHCFFLNHYNILGFIDNNPPKTGNFFYDKQIYYPDILITNKPDILVIATDSFEEVKEQIIQDYPDLISIVENKNYFYKESLKKRYSSESDLEIRTLIKYIDNNGLNVFNYNFCHKYENLSIEVFWDDSYGMYYVIHFGKKLFFSKNYSDKKEVRKYYCSILMEQDEESPHRYLSNEFDVEDCSVVVDVGAAEGNFALEVIDRVSKIYIIESDELWIEALKATFSDYMDKVVIIKAFINSYEDNINIKLDTLIDEPVNFIKMDIEGYEWDALNGAKKLISISNSLKLAVCCYHSDFDQELIESFMDKQGINYVTTDGYMWFPECVRQTYVSTKFNRAIVRGWK